MPSRRLPLWIFNKEAGFEAKMCRNSDVPGLSERAAGQSSAAAARGTPGWRSGCQRVAPWLLQLGGFQRHHVRRLEVTCLGQTSTK